MIRGHLEALAVGDTSDVKNYQAQVHTSLILTNKLVLTNVSSIIIVCSQISRRSLRGQTP